MFNIKDVKDVLVWAVLLIPAFIISTLLSVPINVFLTVFLFIFFLPLIKEAVPLVKDLIVFIYYFTKLLIQIGYSIFLKLARDKNKNHSKIS